MEPVYEAVSGPFGDAEPIVTPDLPSAAETVCSWIITAPAYHPAWSQYLLAVVRLRDDIPGFPPPQRKFDGTTHEMLVVAINPDQHWDAQSLHQLFLDGGAIPYLTPINIAEQFIATDDEMRQMASLAVQAVVHGALTPETSDAPSRVRESWLVSMTKTLAHIRGEAHAQ